MSVQRQVSGSSDVTLEAGNAIGGVDAQDAGEVDLARTVPEVGDGVGRPVIGEDDLGRFVQPIQRLDQRHIEGRQRLDLIVDRDDDR